MTTPSGSHVLICTFDGAARADDAAEALRALDKRLDALRLGNIAVVRKDADGTISFWESDEMPMVELSAAFGMVLGWLLGAVGTILGAPLGPSVGLSTGAELGKETAFAGDFGFPDEQLRHLAERLDAGSSALIALVQRDETQVLEAELERLGGTITEHALPPDALKQ